MSGIKLWLLRWLYVDDLLKAAFYEGFKCAGSVDPLQCKKLKVNPADVKRMIVSTSSWRSVDEAWVNSDTEELLK